jgi:hypothetical protein
MPPTPFERALAKLRRVSLQSQVLVPDNTSLDPGESLAARVKDPLWFLARQWQTGEFAAENGGRPVQMDVEWETYPLDEITCGSETTAIEPEIPLDSVLEEESVDGGARAWDSASLEYEARLGGSGWSLGLHDYEGRELDWYHCDVEQSATEAAPETGRARVVPTLLYFEGMPHPRWWRFEESGSGLFDPKRDTEPNALSMMLSEYLCLDANNWFVVPLVQRVGRLRAITRLRAVDSFGVTTELPPAQSAPDGAGWTVFTLSGLEGTPSSEYLLVPSVGSTVEGDVLEEVRFIRDEQANLVWAVEDQYFDIDRGARVRRGDEPPEIPAPEGGANADLADAPAYRFKSDLAAHWIPYVPILLPSAHPEFGQIFFRRARSILSASSADPQYKGRMIGESWRLLEEEIPRVGLRVQRRWRYAQAPDGSEQFWIGRRKELGQREASAGLEFDFLEE